MSHYFDDILHRQLGAGGHTPNVKSPMLSPTTPRLRRSSTSRSLAARSDFSANHVNDLNGDHHNEGQSGADAGPYDAVRRGSVNPAVLNDPERVKEREEADRHLHLYISQQLERVRLERGASEYAGGDEFEAKASE